MFKVSANTNGSSNGGSSSSGQPAMSIGGNHQMKLSSEIKMEVEDEYSNDSRSMKRKRDDDDDFEYEEEFEAVGWREQKPEFHYFKAKINGNDPSIVRLFYSIHSKYDSKIWHFQLSTY